MSRRPEACLKSSYRTFSHRETLGSRSHSKQATMIEKSWRPDDAEECELHRLSKGEMERMIVEGGGRRRWAFREGHNATMFLSQPLPLHGITPTHKSPSAPLSQRCLQRIPENRVVQLSAASRVLSLGDEICAPTAFKICTTICHLCLAILDSPDASLIAGRTPQSNRATDECVYRA